MRSATIAWLVLIAATATAQDLADVQIEAVELGDGLAMLVGRGGNIGVSIGDDGTFLIDDQFAPLAPRIEAAVAALGGGSVRFVLNTHYHGDHTGGNEPLGKAGAVLMAHHKVRQRMSATQRNALRGTATPPAPEAALPLVTFLDDVAFHLNGHTLRAHYAPNAHTDGDVIVSIDDTNVLHLGDTYFAGMYPYIDVDGGGSIDGMIAAAEQALALANERTRIIPGHGPLSNRAELAAYRDMLVGVRRAVQGEIDAGHSAEQAIAAKPTSALDAQWGAGFMKPEHIVSIVYRSLSQGQQPARSD